MAVKKIMYSLRETATILGVKVRTLRYWITCGKLTASKYPNCKNWYVSEEEINKFLEGK